jgi:photosystem II stability/assembly factor-like uncharacterized protein
MVFQLFNERGGRADPRGWRAASVAPAWRRRYAGLEEATVDMAGEQTVMTATDEGLHEFELGAASDHSGRRVDELAGHEVLALELSGGGPWVIVDGKELWRRAEGRWARVASTGRRRATCLAATPAGLLVGTARAHLLRLEGHQLQPVSGFDEAEGRDTWYTPWGAPADVRSISAGTDGSLYVNVHVGGVLRSTDGGTTWRPLLDIEHDVHQVYAPAGHRHLVLVAAFDGFGVSRDGGDTWTWENEGLHAHYCRAVALGGDTVILSASTGHHGRRAALYRRALEAGTFERCAHGLPEWFSDNVDTGCVAAQGDTVVIGTEDGCVFASADGGRRWETLAKGLAAVRAVALA